MDLFELVNTNNLIQILVGKLECANYDRVLIKLDIEVFKVPLYVEDGVDAVADKFAAQGDGCVLLNDLALEMLVVVTVEHDGSLGDCERLALDGEHLC